MGWFEGLISGYAGRRREIEADNMRRAELAQARENRVFELLLNSDDPEIASMAATGLITGTQPQRRKRGLGAWMGEMEANPAYPKLLEYMRTPKFQGYEEITTPKLRASFRFPTQAGLNTAPQAITPNQGGMTAALPGVPPGQPPAALPEAQTTTPGTPGPAAGEAVPAPGPTPPPPPPGAAAEPQGAPLLPPLEADTSIYDTPPGVDTPPGQEGLGQIAWTAGGVAPPPTTAPGFRTGVVQGTPAAPTTPPPQPPFHTMTPDPGYEVRQGAAVYGPPQPFQTQAQATSARYRSEVQGVLDAYTDLFASILPPGPDLLRRARQEAAKLYASEKARATGSSNPLGMWFNRALEESPYTLAEIQADPAKAAEVNARASELQAESVGATTSARGLANLKIPLSPTQRTAVSARERARWQTIRAPVRRMEMAIRSIEDNYKLYMAGNDAAWEPLRTAFVMLSDPNSVVMPSEFIRGAGIGSLMDRIWGFIGNVAQGGARLPPHQVTAMLESSRAMWAAAKSYGSIERSAIEAAISNPMVNISPAEVFGNDELRFEPEPLPAAAPASGGPANTPAPAAGGPPAPPARVTPGGRTLQRGPTGWSTSRPGASGLPTGKARPVQNPDGTWDLEWDDATP
jgi:hypothetical protein